MKELIFDHYKLWKGDPFGELTDFSGIRLVLLIAQEALGPTNYYMN
jgi:hypothetical protein